MKTILGMFENYASAQGSIAELHRLGLAGDVGLLSRTNGHAGAAMSPLELPGLGKVHANAPMLALLDTRGARGGSEGAFGMLLRMGISRDDAEGYLAGLQRGGVFEAFDVPDDKEAQALAIVHQHAERRAAEEIVIPIVEEELYVGKREVPSAVRLDTHIIAEPVEKTISILEERIDVERRAVDRLVDAQPELFAERTFELKAMAEEPLVTKRARVVEEVRIHRDRKERIETVRDTLRHTEVDVTESPYEPVDFTRFTDHFKNVYEPQGVSFATLAPAYEFGERLRRRSQHGDWSVIESRVSASWERKNPGTWERFRDAIRAGWESRETSERRER